MVHVSKRGNTKHLSDAQPPAAFQSERNLNLHTAAAAAAKDASAAVSNGHVTQAIVQSSAIASAVLPNAQSQVSIGTSTKS